MAGMKRFVTYIYAYEDGRKGSNIGFAKIEIRGEDCRIEIHMRGVYVRQSVCKVQLFREKDGHIEGFPIGEMRLSNGNGDFGVMIKDRNIVGSPFGMNHMEGIILLSEDERVFASRWKEGRALDVRTENIRAWQPDPAPTPVPKQAAAAFVSKQPAPVPPPKQSDVAPVPEQLAHALAERALQSTYSVQAVKPVDQVRPETVQAAESVDQAQQEDMQATEIPVRNIFPRYDWQIVWEKLIQNHMVYTPFEDRAAECIQIELKDLRELPRRYWYLGNNSFMLHGFFNYSYLVVGRTGEERWFIGVPGIYQRQERVMAVIFGFPEFIPVISEEENDEKGEPTNRFGCWFRYIEEL